ncbi:sensor histidine kinase [Tenacibaculum sp. E3R01]|uniref:sensor histidine kinase n=1 Tax=Tenacibaculum sp. E3R01 TaxID=2267227 RepID=UPI000DE99738|nr:HAMP domain-containing sensor histidine kinase [Tenacibaculum sp. E3R01]RBW62374.1 sensor histidine kinase [Tenacibaculum sp. E3R01]
MKFFQNTFWLKRIVVLISIVIVSLILWNTYIFFQKFKEEERNKMELFAAAMKEFGNNSNLDDVFNIEGKVIENTKSIPLILTSEKGEIIESQNLDSLKVLNPKYLEKQLQIMKDQNDPIEISYKNTQKQYVYYRNSDLLYKLKYYPLALLLILGLFITIIYMVFKSSKVAEQNKLWTGMAKETAHQIGTPLSSLLGWIAIFRTENIDQMYVDEIEKDVDRLNIIANRFSKIGSLPELKQHNIVSITKTVFNYLESRSSKQISFSFNASQEEINTQINTELFGWVIENLIKNAIDAMQGKGTLDLSIKNTSKKVKITISDSGKGMHKSQFKQVFKPGFTTKKRGWGLGLSLSKRIIEDYHKGKIFVQKSEIGKGTTFQILLDKF